VPVQTYVEEKPPAPLAELVSTVWIQHVPADSEPYLQRNIPNGSSEILCRLGQAPRVIGQRTMPSIDVLPPGTTVVGARVRPGATRTVFGVPGYELVDRSVDVAELESPGLDVLGEQLAGARSPDETADVLKRRLLAQCAVAPAIDPVVSETVRRLEGVGHGGLRAIRSELSLSERHFRRRVRQAVGLTPKVLERMLRFQRLLASTQSVVARGEDPTDAGVAALAAAAGYADESHLNRECRRLTGLSIGQYLAETCRDCGCGHDHGASFSRILGLSS